jgi:60 kDa SS-A/Ro ribonucleoprotein
MANKNLFSKKTSVNVPAADTTNAAGGKAYAYAEKHALAQIAATNTFNGTFYASAENNLEIAKNAAKAVLTSDPEFVAKVAVYSRSKAYMKDMPAFLTVLLSQANTKLFRKVFPKVIDNGKMLRNFVQMGRSGIVTGKSVNMTSYAIKAMLQSWFDGKSPYALFKASIGNDPSMRDILRMAHVRPNTAEKAALFAYMKGAEYDAKKRLFCTMRYKNPNKGGEKYVLYEHSFDALPDIVRKYENYKETRVGEIPDVDFRLLDSLGMDKDGWKEIARRAPWQMTRMNLNTFQRHGVFDDPKMVRLIAERLSNAEMVKQSRCFPYQLLMAYQAATSVPQEIRLALQEAMEAAVNNVPKINGKMYICVDTSGSMSSAVTGYRAGSTSSVRCVDVAALFASSMLRTNKLAKVIPFDTRTYNHDLNPMDSIMTNANKLASYGGGGTNCSLPLAELNAAKAKGDLIVFVSDNESWVDSEYRWGTGLMTEWLLFKKRNPQAKLVCIDLTPSPNSQVKEHQDILQVGGFSDQVFTVIHGFMEGGNDADYWVKEIEKVSLESEKEKVATDASVE